MEARFASHLPSDIQRHKDCGSVWGGYILNVPLKVDSDDVQELLDSHSQELTMDELIEMHEQDIEELESLDQFNQKIDGR
ncbi:hypothetical protein TNCV_4120941 [Trichonephila clavipes]|nr:hypothetical protein TNCV_4120941 [Trichonephila clavipes]